MPPAWISILIAASGFLLTVLTTVAIVSRKVGNWEQEQRDQRKDIENLFGLDRERKTDHEKLNDKFQEFRVAAAKELGINGHL